MRSRQKRFKTQCRRNFKDPLKACKHVVGDYQVQDDKTPVEGKIY